jgi:hypothetical protein
MDFFVVPTIGFELLYACVVIRIERTATGDPCSWAGHGPGACAAKQLTNAEVARSQPQASSST